MWVSTWHLGRSGYMPPRHFSILDCFTLHLVHSQVCIVLNNCSYLPKCIISNNYSIVRKTNRDPAWIFNKLASHHNSDITTKWKCTISYQWARLKMNGMKAQLKELAYNDMFNTFFPNLSKICMCNLYLDPCHDSFSRKKPFFKWSLLKTTKEVHVLNNKISNLIKIALESQLS